MSEPSISELFQSAARQMRADFDAARYRGANSSAIGNDTEQVLQSFLASLLPQRFRTTKAVLIDRDEHRSREIDVAVFDALNSPVLSTGTVSILPNEGVAVVIEVKASLDAEDLRDAYVKIASAKRLKRAPVGQMDVLATGSPVSVYDPLGVVFAFDSRRTVQAVASQVVTLNHEYHQSLWPDMIVVLDKGVIAYGVRFPGEEAQAPVMSPTPFRPVRSPYIVHLNCFDDDSLSLNRFVNRILTHLALFVHRYLNPPFSKLLNGAPANVRVIAGYQHASNGILNGARSEAVIGGVKPTAEISLSIGGEHFARLEYLPWQSDAVIRCGPGPSLASILASVDLDEVWDQQVYGPTSAGDYLTSVMRLSVDQFIGLAPQLIAEEKERKAEARRLT